MRFQRPVAFFWLQRRLRLQQRTASHANLPDSLVVMTAADSQRQTQLQQEIPQKNGDTKPSNAGTPGGQPVAASKRQPKRILGL